MTKTSAKFQIDPNVGGVASTKYLLSEAGITEFLSYRSTEHFTAYRDSHRNQPEHIYSPTKPMLFAIQTLQRQGTADSPYLDLAYLEKPLISK